MSATQTVPPPPTDRVNGAKPSAQTMGGVFASILADVLKDVPPDAAPWVASIAAQAVELLNDFHRVADMQLRERESALADRELAREERGTLLDILQSDPRFRKK